MVGEHNSQKGPVFIDYEKVKSILLQYDENQKEHLKKGLGFEDTRVNFFRIDQLDGYIEKIKKLAKEKGIEITGVSFISGAYPSDYEVNKNQKHQTLIYVPTAIVDGKNVPIDLEHSTSSNIVTFKEMLEKKNYFWMYDCKEDYERGELEGSVIKGRRVKEDPSSVFNDKETSVANHGQLCPPY